MIESIGISLLTLACGSLVTYFIAKKMTGTDRIIGISYDLLDEFTDNAEMQKKLYLLGAILGHGIKSGIGIGKTGGKFKMEDIIGMALQHFFGGGVQSQGNQTQGNVSNTQGTISDLRKV